MRESITRNNRSLPADNIFLYIYKHSPLLTYVYLSDRKLKINPDLTCYSYGV